MDSLAIAKITVPVALLALFWGWETCWPFFGDRQERYRHAWRNLALALTNTLILGGVFGWLTAKTTQWTQQHQIGLFHYLSASSTLQFILALVILDGWMYWWHRANHVVPLLWRFHRVHHSDRHMDVTTATRFHLGEHIGASILRLGLIFLIGFTIWHIVVYELIVIAITQFHHANISLGCWDRWLRLVLVTPDMHKIHHSNRRPETDSNYSTLFSVWDRLARSFQTRSDVENVQFGLLKLSDPAWQTWTGMWKTPFVDPASSSTNPLPQCVCHEGAGEGKAIHLLGYASRQPGTE